MVNEYPKVTLIMTSGKRPELFIRTVESFLENCLDRDLIKEWICCDDDTDKKSLDRIKRKYPFIKIYPSPNHNQASSLNFLLSRVRTEWFLQTEDDWQFIKKDNFIRKMFDIAFDDEKIKSVGLRFWEGIFVKSNDLEYRVHAYLPDEKGDGGWKNNWGWYGYSLNPSLQHLSTIRKLGKYSEEITERGFDKEIAKGYYDSGYRVANLNGEYIRHIGEAKSLYGLKEDKKLTGKKPNLWTYWENRPGEEMPYYISLCLNSIKEKCGKDFNINIVNEKTRLDYLENTGLLGQAFSLSNISQKVDCFRIALLKRYGGIWVDADTLVLKSFLPLYNSMKGNDFLYMRWDDGRVLNGYLAGKRYAGIFSEWIDEINNQLKTMSSDDLVAKIDMADWARFGEKIVSKLFSQYKDTGKEIRRNLLIPVNFDRDPKAFFNPGKIKNYLTNQTLAISFNHSAFYDFRRDLIKRNKEEFLKGGDLFADAIRMAI